MGNDILIYLIAGLIVLFCLSFIFPNLIIIDDIKNIWIITFIIYAAFKFIRMLVEDMNREN